MNRLLRSWLVLLVPQLAPILVFAMCCVCMGAAGQTASTKPQLRDDAKDEPKGAAATMPRQPEGNIASVDIRNYKLGPEDVIYIKTWREADFSFTTAVRPDGKITLPLYGDIRAADLTPEQLALNIKEALTKYINAPDVQVFVQDVRSKKYFVDGQVRKTGPYPLVTKTTVLEALSDCGGFLDFANLRDIHILRGDKVLHFNYKDVTRGKHMEKNIDLENGDHIIVN